MPRRKRTDGEEQITDHFILRNIARKRLADFLEGDVKHIIGSTFSLLARDISRSSMTHKAVANLIVSHLENAFTRLDQIKEKDIFTRIKKEGIL